jgi:hypothetical protein
VPDDDAEGVDEVARALEGVRDELSRIVARLRTNPDGQIGEAGKWKTEAAFARHLLWERRTRDRAFISNVFGEPAWDMMLDLFAAHEEGRSVSVSSICIAAAVPQTTALRWLAVLEAHGYVLRKNDPRDRRRVFVDLAPATADSVKTLLRLWMDR